MNYLRLKNMNCFGGAAQSLVGNEVNTPNLCMAACENHPTCQSAVFVAKTGACFLKSNVTSCVITSEGDSYMRLR